MWRMGAVLAVAWGMTALASGQYQTGEAVRVSVEDLSSTGMLYHQRLVITRGEVRYGDLEDEANEIFELRGDDALRTVRIATQQGSYEDLRFMSGQGSRSPVFSSI